MKRSPTSLYTAPSAHPERTGATLSLFSPATSACAEGGGDLYARRSASYWPTFIRSALPLIHEGP